MCQRALRLLALVALVLAPATGSAQGIAYTVQVVAVSDGASALALQQDLVEQGFPAYLLTVPTQQGLVYRLRVGAFGNRAAAARYAEALPSQSGNPAIPALAESVPAGLIALEPSLLERTDPTTTSVTVLPWSEDAVIRTQSRDPSLGAAVYLLPDGRSLRAWRAAPQRDGSVLLVYPFSLWSDAWETQSDAERASFRQTVLGNVAASLGLEAAALEPYIFTPDAAPPYLALVDRWQPLTGERQRLPALGQVTTDLPASGPGLVWLASDQQLEIRDPQPLLQVNATPQPKANVSGEGWRALEDDAFVRLEVEGNDRAWRAVPGQPLWAEGSLLALVDGGEVVFYRLNVP